MISRSTPSNQQSFKHNLLSACSLVGTHSTAYGFGAHHSVYVSAALHHASAVAQMLASGWVPAHSQVGGTAGQESPVQLQDRHIVAHKDLMSAEVVLSMVHEVDGTTRVQAVGRIRDDCDTHQAARQVGEDAAREEVEPQEEVEARM